MLKSYHSNIQLLTCINVHQVIRRSRETIYQIDRFHKCAFKQGIPVTQDLIEFSWPISILGQLCTFNQVLHNVVCDSFWLGIKQTSRDLPRVYSLRSRTSYVILINSYVRNKLKGVKVGQVTQENSKSISNLGQSWHSIRHYIRINWNAVEMSYI